MTETGRGAPTSPDPWGPPPQGVRRAAVIGSPVAHSLSPALHRAGFAAAGLDDWSYEAIECDAAGVAALLDGLPADWAGLSVTMPNKAAAAAVADRRSPRVEQLGVANTLFRRHVGWCAENTDIDGILGALAATRAPAPTAVLILGGGGTTLAVIAALAEVGSPRLVLAGRRPESTVAAVDLAERLGLATRTIGFDDDAVRAAAANVDLVVSTVPAGAADHLAGAVAGAPVLLDVLYHPWPTALAAARTGGTVTGLDMLLHQAFRQFLLFTGVPAPTAAMRDGLRAASGTELPLPLR